MFHFWPTITWLARYFWLGAFNSSFLSVTFPMKLECISTCHFKGVFQHFECWSPTSPLDTWTFLKPWFCLQVLQGYISLSSKLMKTLKKILCPGQMNAGLCWHAFIIWRETNSNWLILIHHMILIKRSPSLPTGMSCGTGSKSVLNARCVTSIDLYSSVTLSKAF